MSIKLAHIINPFTAPLGSDLKTAQPITFESMRTAKKVSETNAIELLSAQFEEDRGMVPEGFRLTHDLTVSVLDFNRFSQEVKLPLLKHILDRLHDESQADYFIYSNVDIALYPSFYTRILELLKEGYDALIINRRRIPAIYTKMEELNLMIQEKGKKHPGFDCFVFHRDIYTNMHLESVCIGVPFVGITLAHNIFALAKKYKWITEERLTFHLGMEIFRRRVPREYYYYNRKQFWLAMNLLASVLCVKKIPFASLWLPARLIKWGLHPNFPIRLMLLLEWRKLMAKFNLRHLGRS